MVYSDKKELGHRRFRGKLREIETIFIVLTLLDMNVIAGDNIGYCKVRTAAYNDNTNKPSYLHVIYRHA